MLQRAEAAWYLEDVEQAVQCVLKRGNTNFESLIENLENNPDQYDAVFKWVMNEENFLFSRYNAVIAKGLGS